MADARDPNGLLLNPRWSFQTGAGDGPLALADPESQCGGFPTKTEEGRRRGDPRCTDQETAVDVPTGWHKPVCGAEFFSDGRWGRLRGHVNWEPVTVAGFLTWNDAAGRYPLGDGDYTLSLEPADAEGRTRQPGLTRYNKVKGYATHAYHVEFSSTETVVHFSHPWWAAHRSRVAARTVHSVGDGQAGQIPDGTWAVATGLFGLDAEHKGHSELHPVYALALLTSCGTSPDAQGYFDDEWAVFVRSFGNEGFCADWKAYHMLDLPDSVYALRLALPGADLSSAVLGERTRLLANLPRPGEATRPGRGPFLVPSGSGVEVRFRLPEMAGAISRQNDPPRMHGLLHLRWKAPTSGPRTCPRRPPPPDTAALAAPAEPGADGEDLLDRLLEQRRRSGLALPDAGALAPPPDAVEVTDRAPIPAPPSAPIRDRVVRVPDTAAAEAALARDVDEAPPPEVCDGARELLATPLDGEARRRMEELLRYCQRTRRASAEALLRSAHANPDSAAARGAWLASLPKVDGYYLVEGDIKMTEAEARDYLSASRRAPREPSAELSVNLANGVPTYWKERAARRLTYAVDRASFPDRAGYEEVVNAMTAAGRDWEAACPACGVSFTHLPERDRAPSGDGVHFVVRYVPADAGLLASAFYPNDAPLRRFVDIYPAFFTSGIAPDGVLRHELGHVLGYRHAHIEVPGCYAESGQWLPLTPYDPRSVMHYLCGGGGDPQLLLTASDREGHRRLYGAE